MAPASTVSHVSDAAVTASSWVPELPVRQRPTRRFHSMAQVEVQTIPGTTLQEHEVGGKRNSGLSCSERYATIA